jgi:alpha-beta hydrolase superfamily lysophospholipase
VFCPADAFRSLAERLGSRCESVLLPGAEHLLTTHLEALESAVARFATAHLAANPGL